MLGRSAAWTAQAVETLRAARSKIVRTAMTSGELMRVSGSRGNAIFSLPGRWRKFVVDMRCDEPPQNVKPEPEHSRFPNMRLI